jgi:hypothetical protein
MIVAPGRRRSLRGAPTADTAAKMAAATDATGLRRRLVPASDPHEIRLIRAVP